MEAYFGASVDVSKKPILITAPCAGDIPAHFGDLARDAKDEGQEVMALIANGNDGQQYEHQDTMKRDLEIFDQRYLGLAESQLDEGSAQDYLARVIAARVTVRRVGSIATYGPEGRGEETHKAMHTATLAAQKLLAAGGVHVPVLALGKDGYDVIMPEATQEAPQALAA